MVGGEDVLDALEKLQLKDGTERPAKAVRIQEVIMYVLILLISTPNGHAFSYQDPFEEYKSRRAKKLAKRAEAEQPDKTDDDKRDDMNWFGEKLGSKGTIFGTDTGSSVGKYLSLKRPQDPVASGAETRKKRKLGFGDFEGW